MARRDGGPLAGGGAEHGRGKRAGGHARVRAVEVDAQRGCPLPAVELAVAAATRQRPGGRSHHGKHRHLTRRLARRRLVDAILTRVSVDFCREPSC